MISLLLQQGNSKGHIEEGIHALLCSHSPSHQISYHLSIEMISEFKLLAPGRASYNLSIKSGAVLNSAPHFILHAR